jgi:hypothetical protein
VYRSRLIALCTDKRSKDLGGRIEAARGRSKELIMTAVQDAPVATEGSVSEEQARELATQWANGQATRLTERVQNYLAKKNGQSNGGVTAHIGAPTTNLGGPPYVAFDVVATSPITVAGPQLIYPPSKIIPEDSLSFLVAFIYTNPATGPGWAVPASIALGARPWRMTVDQTNLTTGATGTLVANGVFGSPAATITPVLFLLPTGGPVMGSDPWLIEANVTVYVDVPAQPFAAFATSFYDIDNDPGFPFNPPYLPPVPPEGAGYRYDVPNRYLIFP